MSIKVSEKIKSLVPYKAGQSEKDVKEKYKVSHFVKLASNESPIGPSEKVEQALLKQIANTPLYPDPMSRDLREKAGEYYSVSPENIVAGNGSNELIDLLIKIFCEPGEKVLTAASSFIAYKVCAAANRADLVEIPLRSDYTINLKAFTEFLEQQLDQQKALPKIVFIPNPNNPLGSYIAKKEMDDFMSLWGGREDMVLVIDEAYNEFVAAEDYPQSLEYLKYGNVVVLKTMSKVFSLASLRLGFLLSSPEVVDLVNRVRNPFNVNAMAQVAGQEALKDLAFLDKNVSLVKEGRKDLEAFFSELGVDFVSSQANFVFFDAKKDSNKAHDYFLSQGLILRPLKPYKFSTQMRITIGTPEQMDFAKAVLKEYFSRQV